MYSELYINDNTLIKVDEYKFINKFQELIRKTKTITFCFGFIKYLST